MFMPSVLNDDHTGMLLRLEVNEVKHCTHFTEFITVFSSQICTRSYHYAWNSKACLCILVTLAILFDFSQPVSSPISTCAMVTIFHSYRLSSRQNNGMDRTTILDSCVRGTEPQWLRHPHPDMFSYMHHPACKESQEAVNSAPTGKTCRSRVR